MSWRPALWLVAIAVVAVDQLTKMWALSALGPQERHQLLGDLLSLQLVFNSGAAFSLGSSSTWIMTIIAVLVTVGIVYFARRAQSRLAVVLFGVGLGGALGNLIDRLFRQPSFGQGHVVDMINYNGWFVGNVADLAIVGVAGILLVMSFRGKPLLIAQPADAVKTNGQAGNDAADQTTDIAVDANEATGASAAKSPPRLDEPRE